MQQFMQTSCVVRLCEASHEILQLVWKVFDFSSSTTNLVFGNQICLLSSSNVKYSTIFFLLFSHLLMENTEGDLASGQAFETTTPNNNSVTESSSSSASVQESTMVTLLKTMQEQLQVSNQLLFGLFSETKRPLSRKRRISVADSDDE